MESLGTDFSDLYINLEKVVYDEHGACEDALTATEAITSLLGNVLLGIKQQDETLFDACLEDIHDALKALKGWKDGWETRTLN